jgi:hypothetical protein
MATQKAVQQFGADDYERLLDMGSDEVQHINEVAPSRAEITQALQTLVKARKLYVMDKENGVAFRASVVVGFKGDSILIANER